MQSCILVLSLQTGSAVRAGTAHVCLDLGARVRHKGGSHWLDVFRDSPALHEPHKKTSPEGEVSFNRKASQKLLVELLFNGFFGTLGSECTPETVWALFTRSTWPSSSHSNSTGG